MITNKADLKEYIRCDQAMYQMRSPHFLGWVLGDESYIVLRYLRILRHLEYYTNKRKRLFDYIYYYYYMFRHRRMSINSGIQIGVNMVGKGIYIPHFRGGVIVNCIHMGDNCVVSTGVVIGNKGCRDNRAYIGNNVEITTGAKVIGKISIGNNVIIAPNSVVVKNVPDNWIVSGVPAKYLKLNDQIKK